jgi:hypothetical protein
MYTHNGMQNLSCSNFSLLSCKNKRVQKWEWQSWAWNPEPKSLAGALYSFYCFLGLNGDIIYTLVASIYIISQIEIIPYFNLLLYQMLTIAWSGDKFDEKNIGYVLLHNQ